MSWPPAELVIDAALVESLLASQFPHLSELDCRHVAEGFDNSLWRLGDDLVVRVPRRAAAVELTLNELRWLPNVAAHVTLRTPLPLLEGVPDQGYPWHWSITSWIEGVPGDQIDLDDNGDAAEALATFLREIHVDAPTDAPRNPVRGVTLSARTDIFKERLAQVKSLIEGEPLLDLWDECVAAPTWSSSPRWLHGDFHPANTVYRDGKLVGVVDFGDLCAGDPATDLAGGLMSLPFHALDDFFGSYRFVDSATLQRTIGWALLFGVFMVTLGVDSRPSYLPVGQRTLLNAVQLADTL
ncbi:MAG TPA: aminoglycoside phosphotransferase family protein [Acidimicrobiales bacterium]|nr:aminoglycoside phosphotransferase family protein [Acidimicrobiales bacterium]